MAKMNYSPGAQARAKARQHSSLTGKQMTLYEVTHKTWLDQESLENYSASEADAHRLIRSMGSKKQKNLRKIRAEFPGGDRFAYIYLAVRRHWIADDKLTWDPSHPLDLPPRKVLADDVLGEEIGYDAHEPYLLNRDEALGQCATYNAERLQFNAEKDPMTCYWGVPVELGLPCYPYFSAATLTGVVGMFNLNQYLPMRVVKPTKAEIEKFGKVAVAA